MQAVPLPDALRAVARPTLEEYVGARVKQFSRVFAGVLLPSINSESFEFAFARATQLLGQTVQEPRVTDSYALRFTHRCRFLGCMRKECPLCKNNPNKKCREEDNFDECYADGQVLKSKCEADVYLELINLRTGLPEALPSVEIAVSVVDGESYSETAPSNYGHVKELLKNDDESVLLGAYQAGSKTDADGRLYLRMNEGQVKLPDVCVTDKNDTFHLNNETFGTFRLMARAVRREGYGHLAPVENVRPSVSGRFIVKTQRALNDYRKSEYPHFKDELTKLKHIGSITAQRLREIQSHLDCPYSTIETVEQLKQLMLYADQNRQVENKMLELLNMKGKHKHKWDYLREVLAERVVYDDMLHRLWYTDESVSQGVLFACKQGQINMDRPIGLVHRAANGRLVVTSSPSGQEAETLKQWRSLAETAWHQQGHHNWAAVQEQLEMVTAGSGGTSLLIGGGASMSMGPTPSMSIQDGMDDQMLGKRGSVGMAPSMMTANDERRSRRSSAVSYQQGPNSPKLEPGGLLNMMQQQAASSSLGDLQQQGMAGGQQQFQFQGNRSMATHALITSGGLTPGDLMPDVYRTASAPNMAATSSPLYSHNSIDSAGGGTSNLLGGASGPPSNSTLGGQGDGVLPPQPTRPARYRRLSADASAVRQMAMMQAASVPQQDTGGDLGKRSRNSVPGHPMLEELQQMQQQQMQQQQMQQQQMQQQLQQQHQHQQQMQQQQMQQQQLQQQQMQQQGAGGADVQLAMANRHALYHFESRGRHTPRSRLSTEVSDTVAATALGSVLDTSDIETYLAQNFSFITGEPAYAGGEQQQPGVGASASGVNLGPSSSSGLSGTLMQMTLQQPDALTGQMQNTLLLNDQAAGRMGSGGPSGSGLMGLDSGVSQQQHYQQQQYQQQQHYQQQQMQQQQMQQQQMQQQQMQQQGMGMGGGMNMSMGGGSGMGHMAGGSMGMPGVLGGGGMGVAGSAGAVAGNPGGSVLAPGRALQHMDSGNMLPSQANRELKRCESDSFKRFLAVGLPFSPMEATPEEMFESQRRDSGLMGD